MVSHIRGTGWMSAKPLYTGALGYAPQLPEAVRPQLRARPLSPEMPKRLGTNRDGQPVRQLERGLRRSAFAPTRSLSDNSSFNSKAPLITGGAYGWAVHAGNAV